MNARREIAILVPFAVAVLAAVVAVSVWWLTADQSCSDSVSGRICASTLRVEADGRLPTAAELLAELPSGRELVHGWHLGGPSDATNVAGGGRTIEVFGACAGGGTLVVSATSHGDPMARLNVRCDGVVGPGMDVTSTGAAEFTITATTEGDVTEAEYFLVGSTS